MKKKKCNPSYYFYQEININYLMLKTNENIFELLQNELSNWRVHWRLEVFCFLEVHVSRNNNVFCLLLLLFVAMYFEYSTVLLMHYSFLS